MATPKPGVDLEKELTCSICTEILFQPTTLLDCLHTYCGSCLKEWFEFQYVSASTKPDPPPPGTNIYSCPSCRAPVRNTRGNATVTSLVDLYLAGYPDKVRSKEEQDEMRRKYKPGDSILIPYRRGATQREEHGSGSSSARRRRDHSRTEGSRTRSERDSSRDVRHRPRREDERRRHTESNGMLQPDSSSDEQRGNRSESRRRAGAQQAIRDSSSAARARHVEHQASIRSLISSSDVDSRDLEREIDDFARQIQEEGLLDGLDLDNIDLTQNDELSRKITEAYRRRQRARPRAESARSSAANVTSHRSETAQSQSRPPVTDSLRPASRQRSNSAHVRTPSSSSQSNERSRPPITSARLDVHSDSERRRRRRTSSDARSATDPIRPSTAETRPAARSQTDLTIRSQSSDPSARRPSLADSRSSSMPIDSSRGPSSGEQPSAPSGNGARDLSFSGRAAAQSQTPMPPPLLSPIDDSGGERPRRRRRPSSLVVPQSPLPSLGLLPSPTHQTHHQKPRHQFYPEPSITCSQCQRPHIEYELHYNCAQCSGGEWNICLSCYRTGKGCLHWFGFGYAAFSNWDRQRVRSERALDPPHMLTANRYIPPRSAPGGAEGRKTLTTEDPAFRLESGMFCVRCLVWANACYWRCDYCNDGDWGFCNGCVNQGYGCKHPLLPLTYVQPPSSPSPSPSPSLSQSSSTPPGSPGSRQGNRHHRPRSATLFTGPNALAIGNFRPLVFTTTCDVCQEPIQPADRRYHCNKCTSQVVPDTQPGDYDICLQCYDKLAADGQISSDNGCEGWRRCLRGHRMSILGFNEGKGGQRRLIMRDIVGGTGLTTAPHESDQTLQRWHWYVSGTKVDRVATVEVGAKLPEQLQQQQHEFPPDGGAGLRGDAKWSWYPAAGAEDELMFPRGAEILEIEDVNGDWCHGSYMGAKGLFPAPYVNILT